MNIEDFIKVFATETNIDACLCTSSSNFKDLEGWSSLAAVLTIAMIDEEYGKDISVDELNSTRTLEDLYNLVLSK